jgi:hypothetical protein
VDPVSPGTGGPAGNARLTAWTGLLLLALFLVELVTLLSLNSLISWHIVVGVLLVPPALLKTATTGWRIVRYYTGDRGYRSAGPPPMPLRLLGPLVVILTLSVLGTGLALIALGPDASRTPLVTLLGARIDAQSLHSAAFVMWIVVTGLHTLGRILPALRLATGRPDGPRRLPGGPARIVLLGLTALVAALAAVLVLNVSGPWLTGGLHRPEHRTGHGVSSIVPTPGAGPG